LRANPRRRASVLGLAVLLTAGGAVGVLRWQASRRPPPGLLGEADGCYSAAHRRLLEEIGPVRPLRARLSGQREYQPYRQAPVPRVVRDVSAARGASLNRLAGGPKAPVTPEVHRAIVRAAELQPSSENSAALAVMHLVRGETSAAETELRRALAANPEDPRLLNDLTATLLAEGEAAGTLGPALTALDAAERSARAEPSPAALFNRALALDDLGLRARAIGGWQRYLESDEDPASGWETEARGRLLYWQTLIPAGQATSRLLAAAEIEPAALAQNLWALRQLGEVTLLGRWGERALVGDQAGAEAALATAESIAAALPEANGRLLAATAAAIRDAERSGERRRVAELAQGHAEFLRAFQLNRAERSGEAYRLLAESIASLRSANSPFELRARLLRVAVADQAEWPEIEAIEEAATGMGLPALAAEARREAAYRMTGEGRLAAAVDAYGDAQRRFEALGEWEISAVLDAMRGEIFDAIGDEPTALASLQKALAAAPAVSSPWNRYSIYVVAAQATAGAYARPAVELRREAGAICAELPERPLCAVDSLLWVARLTPDAEVAATALARANELFARAPDSDGRQRTEIALAVARAQWLAGPERPVADREAAAALYADAAQSYSAGGLTPPAARAVAARARVLDGLGRAQEAAAAYREALGMFRLWDRSERFRVENADNRLPRDLRGVYERLLTLNLKAASGAPSRATFLLSEEMHDHLAPRRVPGPARAAEADLERWLAEVPEGTAAVEYALAGGSAVAWIISPGHFEQIELSPAAGLTDRLQETIAASNAAQWKTRTAALFQELLAPVLSRLPTGTGRLVIVPDANLNGIPFRALWDPKAGRYLDEELTVALAPSLRLAFALPGCRTAASPPESLKATTVLSLGFGAFAADLGLDPLRGAAAEAAAVRAIYGVTAPGGVAPPACTGGDWESFRRCSPQAEVIHLATHTAAGATASGTWIAFPRETVTLDRLWRELPPLPASPLVVLSSCQSAAAAGAGEGFGGLARPFLASGARAVVGTLWKIDDGDAATLFPALHRAYRRSGDAAAALREAREALPDWRSRPWAWGSGVAIAGVQRSNN
jgi:CHAT domain-containing protein